MPIHTGILKTLTDEIIQRCLPEHDLEKHSEGHLTIWGAIPDTGKMVGRVCFYEGFAVVRVVDYEAHWEDDDYDDGWKTVCSASYGEADFFEKITEFVKQM
jgi:hypothetical protein